MNHNQKHESRVQKEIPVLLGLFSWLMFTAISGPYGMAGWLLIAVFTVPSRQHSQETIQKIERIQRREAESRSGLSKPLEKEWDEGDTQTNLDLLNYQEIMQTGEDLDKVNLIAMLSFHPSKRSVRLIRKALEDPNDGIRVIAATALQKMDHEFVTRIVALEKSQPAQGLELAHAIDSYWRSGLMDETQQKRYLDRAMELYNKAPSADTESRLARIRLALDCRRLDTAIEMITAELELQPTKSDLLLLKAEYLYLMRQFPKVREVLQKVELSRLREERKIYDVYAWWQRYSS